MEILAICNSLCFYINTFFRKLARNSSKSRYFWLLLRYMTTIEPQITLIFLHSKLKLFLDLSK
uniref:Uncharacterized protein n=1 Tax=Grateloupia filicina TaxID=31455 RepID=A0A2S1FXE8_9FLOR|nr:hypothetical protein Grafi_p103 [Grateloupia filicina]AWD77444.1 hypothetical protein Grafi_p103 [Grateloupia filicina]